MHMNFVHSLLANLKKCSGKIHFTRRIASFFSPKIIVSFTSMHCVFLHFWRLFTKDLTGIVPLCVKLQPQWLTTVKMRPKIVFHLNNYFVNIIF